MKSTLLLFVVLVFGITAYAQNGISFQGIARDPQGNALVNKNIPVKFTIGSFTETQNLATDNFGVFSATIGSVNTSGFNDLVFANISSNLKVEVDGTTIYDDKFNTVPYAKAAENGVPPGSIMPFAGPANKIPAGWLLCDGSSKAKTGIYLKLFEAIGTLWGDDGGNFKLPDLRGMFLRGVNSGRTGIYADPETNRLVGSSQDDEYLSHNHPGTTNETGEHQHSKDTNNQTSDDGDDAIGFENADGEGSNHVGWVNAAGKHTHTVTTENRGGNETRPVNAAVNYIIKY